MNVAEFLEGTMLLCFSAGWYWSIAKMLKVRAAVGKSPFFVVLICSGYALGIASKLHGWNVTGTLSPLIWVYVWNLVVTFTDLALVLHFSRKAEMRA